MLTDRQRLGRERAFWTRLVNREAKEREHAMAVARVRKAEIATFGAELVRSAVERARMHNRHERHWMAERAEFDRLATSGTMTGYLFALLNKSHTTRSTSNV